MMFFIHENYVREPGQWFSPSYCKKESANALKKCAIIEVSR